MLRSLACFNNHTQRRAGTLLRLDVGGAACDRCDAEVARNLRWLSISSARQQSADRYEDRKTYYQFNSSKSSIPPAFDTSKPPGFAKHQNSRARRIGVTAVEAGHEDGPTDFLGIENVTEQVAAFEQQKYFKPGRGYSVLHDEDNRRQAAANQYDAKNQLAPALTSTIYAAEFAKQTAADAAQMSVESDEADTRPKKRNANRALEKRHEQQEMQRSLEIKFRLRPSEQDKKNLEYERARERVAKVTVTGPIENEPKMPQGTKPSSVLVATFGEVRHDADNQPSVFAPASPQSQLEGEKKVEEVENQRLSRREVRRADRIEAEEAAPVQKQSREVRSEALTQQQSATRYSEQPLYNLTQRAAESATESRVADTNARLLEPQARQLTQRQTCVANPEELRNKHHPQDQRKPEFLHVANNSTDANFLTREMFEKAVASTTASTLDTFSTGELSNKPAPMSALEWRNSLLKEAQKVVKAPKSLSLLDNFVVTPAASTVNEDLLTAGRGRGGGGRRRGYDEEEEDEYDYEQPEQSFPRAPSNLPQPTPSASDDGTYRFPPPPAWMPKPLDRPRPGQQTPRQPPRNYRYDSSVTGALADEKAVDENFSAEIDRGSETDSAERAYFSGGLQNSALNNNNEKAEENYGAEPKNEPHEEVEPSPAAPKQPLEPMDKRFTADRWKSFREVTHYWENPLLTDADVVEMLRQSIVYKDDELVAINKPYGMPVHGGPKVQYHVARYLSRLAAVLNKRSKVTADEKVAKKNELFLTHRIDRDATGILLLARSEQMAQRIQTAFAAHQVVKIYRCITRGVPEPARGVIDIPIEEAVKPHANGTRGRQILLPMKQEIWRDRAAVPYNKSRKSQHATKYFTLAAEANCALLDVECSTGHKHQVRVHLADAIRCPILGDHKYTEYDKMAPQRLPDDMLKDLGIPQAKVRHLPMHLHAYKLVLPEFMKDGQNLMIVARPPEWFIKDCSRLGLKAKF